MIGHSSIQFYTAEKVSPFHTHSIQTDQKQVLQSTSNTLNNEIECSRCYESQAKFSCLYCNFQGICAKCDEKVHSVGKFKWHVRKSLDNSLGKEETDRQVSICKKIQFDFEIKDTSKTYNEILEVQLTNLWREAIKNINRKFEDCFRGLANKQKQILDKMQNKFSNDLKGLREGLDKSKVIKNTNFMSNLTSHSRVGENIFQEINNLINKLNFKNILTKNNPENHFQNMRRAVKSPFSSNFTNQCIFQSPNNKFTSLKSNQSESTADFDSMKISQLISNKSKSKFQYGGKKPHGLLTKARSQKQLFNSPSSVNIF